METIHKYEHHSLLIKISNWQPFFKADDVASLLGYSNAQNALQILDNNDKFIAKSGKGDQQIKTLFVSEFGFYFLAIKSSSSEANNIKIWISKVISKALKKEVDFRVTDSKKQFILIEKHVVKVDLLKESYEVEKKELKDMKSEFSFLERLFAEYLQE